MAAPQPLQHSTQYHDWGASLLVAVVPHAAFVLLASTIDTALVSFAVFLATFNIIVCLIVGAVAQRAIVFVSASMCLALFGWVLVSLTGVPGSGTGREFSQQLSAKPMSPSPNPQP